MIISSGNFKYKEIGSIEWITYTNENLSNKHILQFLCNMCGKVTTIKPYNYTANICSVCKRKQTNLKKYGSENVFASNLIKAKIKQTNLQKYGVDNPSKNEKIKLTKETKRLKTCHIKYGINSMQELNNLKNYSYYKNKILKLKRFKDVKPMFDKKKYTGVYEQYLWKCNKCNLEFLSNIVDGKEILCPACTPKNKSKPEREIINWLKSLNINIIENDRKLIKPLELDIYIPSHNIAIEFDGLYWHSDKFKEKNYHLNKTLKCKENGIQLLHIFEDEWVNKQKIVENIIKIRLGLNYKKMKIKQILIKEINSKTKNTFLEKYHIQGKDSASIKLGAFYNDELVGVMTFSNIDKKNFKLSRFATIPDIYISELASKILTYFEKNWSPLTIKSFVDRRWSQGDLYIQLGFELISQTSPNHYYWKNGQKQRHHHYKFRKKELIEFDNYSPGKTRKQIMEEAGWSRIYDCGDYKFIKQKHI